MPRIHKNEKVDEIFGRRLRMARIQAGLTQKQLAEKLGVASIQKYESGENRLPASMLLKAADITGFDPSYFWEGVDDALSPPTAPVEPTAIRAKGDVREFLSALSSIRKSATRRMALSLIRSLAKDETVEEPENAIPERANQSQFK